MYSSTRGIVFHLTRYSDTSLVVKIFTELLGLRSYLVKGARRPNSKMKASLFQPLSLLELVVSDREKSELHHIREARIAYPFKSLTSDINKSSILLFLNELLYKSIREEAANKELFGFIFDNIVRLDQATQNVAHFHLLFAVQLSRYLGFFPRHRYTNEATVFDMEDGVFTDLLPVSHSQLLRGAVCKYFSDLANTPMDKFYELRAGKSIRNELLEKLITYYTIHLPISGEFKSHRVLHELFR